MPQRYRTVSIPENLLEQIQEVVSDPQNGYTTTSEFVKQSIREKLQQFK